MRYRRSIVLLFGLALLAGCDVSSPSAAPSPLPTAGAIPNAPTGDVLLASPVPNGTAYPAPGQGPTAEPSPFPPGYVPPPTPVP
jgi:hypothetical protein